MISSFIRYDLKLVTEAINSSETWLQRSQEWGGLVFCFTITSVFETRSLLAWLFRPRGYVHLVYCDACTYKRKKNQTRWSKEEKSSSVLAADTCLYICPPAVVVIEPLGMQWRRNSGASLPSFCRFYKTPQEKGNKKVYACHIVWLAVNLVTADVTVRAPCKQMAWTAEWWGFWDDHIKLLPFDFI